MSQQYYIRSRNRVEGPYTEARLREMAKRGRFSGYYHVSLDRQTWVRATEYPQLFPQEVDRKTRAARDADGLHLEEPGAEPAPTDPIQGSEASQVFPGDAADLEWFYTQGSQEVGPVSLSQLRQLAAIGQLTYEDFVWNEQMADWVPATTVPEIFPNPNDYPGAGAPARAAPMAIASFVFGLLGASVCFFVGSLLAIILGHVALKQIRDSGNTIGGRGLAVSGLILGYVVLAASVIVGIVVVFVVIMRTAT